MHRILDHLSQEVCFKLLGPNCLTSRSLLGVDLQGDEAWFRVA